MQDQLDQTKSQVITALGQAAESLRNAAALTEGFSALLQHASFVPTSHTHSQLLSSVQLFSQYNQLFGNNLQNGQSNTLPLLVANSLQQPPPTTGTPTDSRPPVPALPVSPTIEADDGAKGKRKRVVEKKEKKVKDPNAPRRPASAYILFQNDVRKEYVTRFPEKPYHEVLAEISKRWSAMTDQEKSRYNEATQAAKLRYVIDKKNYDLAQANGAAPSNPTSPQTPAPDADDVSEDDEKEAEKELKPAPGAEETEESDEDDDGEQPPKKSKVAPPPPPPKSILQSTTEENKKEKKKREKKKTGD